MSRKRKPVLQLGSGSSKLHKYGYSKEFHVKEKKAKTALSTLVGSYSDSEGDDSAAEDGEEPVTAAPEHDNVHKDSAHAAVAATNNMEVSSHQAEKSPDMDDELKNFLSEIEAIPMPMDGGGDGTRPEPAASTVASHQHEQTRAKAVVPISLEESSRTNNSTPEPDIEGGTPVAKPAPAKSRYSMFVKGESEFVNSPPRVAHQESGAKGDAAAATSNVDETASSLDVDIPEEPTSSWQLVQDEGSQYYYYWNTLTNEVTWEIPSEYTQFLLLHREFQDKLARLPPHVLQAYTDRKAREASALATTAATSGEDNHQYHHHASVYGPAARASPSPADTDSKEAAPSSQHHRSKKHKKEKKKRRHRHRHSDSDGDSSGAESAGEAVSKVLEYGPQLPQAKKLSSASASNKTSTSNSSVVNTNTNDVAAAAGPHLLSIVPYLSDADDDDDDDEDEDNDEDGKPDTKEKTKVSASPKEMKAPAKSVKTTSAAVKKDSAQEISPLTTKSETGHEDDTGNTESGGQPVKTFKDQRESEEVKEDSEGGQPIPKESGISESMDNVTALSKPAATASEKKSKKAAKEVIDMFADDLTVPGLASEKNQTTSEMEANVLDKMEQDQGDREPETDADLKEDESRKEGSKDPSPLLHAQASPSITAAKESAKGTTKEPSKALTATSMTVSSASLSKTPEESRKDKSKGPSKLLNIVDYGSEEDDEQRAEESDAKCGKREIKRDEEDAKKSAPATKKRKKEKRRHKHEGKEQEDGKMAEESEGGTLPNVVTAGLGKAIMASVAETLDREISDIVVQTVTQADPSGMSSKSSRSLKSMTGSQASAAEGFMETSEQMKRAEVGRKLSEKHMSAERLAELVAQQERLSEKDTGAATVDMKKDGDGIKDDDDDDDDFDIDDIDRALEVALEKKKVELAKYEEGELKQEKQAALTSSANSHPVTTGPVTDQLSKEEEEGLKAEVKDAADLALSKLEFLDISTDSLSRLQVLLIELQTRLHDWNAGGLSTCYFQEELRVAQGLLEQYELSAVPQGWACQWDRGNNRYYYRNLSTNRIQWDYPDDKGGGAARDADREDKLEQVGGSHRDATDRSKKGWSSTKSSEKGRDRGGAGENGEHRDTAARKKGSSSSSSRHRKRDERDKDRGSKYEKRRDSSNSSHRYRRKRRRRRDHSSSSDSSDGGGGDEDRTASTSVASSNNLNTTTSTGSSRRRHHHHKGSKKKKKRRSEQRSRSPSIEIVDGSNEEDIKSGGKASPVTVVLDASPMANSSNTVSDTSQPPPPPPPPPPVESIDGEPLLKNGDAGTDVDGVAYDDDENGEVDDMDLKGSGGGEGPGEEDEEADRGGMKRGEEDEDDEEEDGANDDGGGGEKKRKETEAEVVNPAIIYKPPQIMVPPQVVAAARQPELYADPQAQMSHTLSSLPTTSTAGVAPVQDQESQPQNDGTMSEAVDETEKQARKKKKEKKLATGPSLLMKKKHMSSMVQKWQKVKKEVEKEDRAKEMRQAAIRKKIEELK